MLLDGASSAEGELGDMVAIGDGEAEVSAERLVDRFNCFEG